MNPIYKFELTAGETTQRAFPIYKDDLAKDFEKESNQEFFRAKLSGKLTFESEDYTFIVSKAFDTQFVLEIFISYNAGQSWTSYWRGTFWKTDCEFDNDTQIVVVQPTVWDQYNDVLAGLDKEYNLIELAPEIVSVKADKRPMVQVYVPGQSVIACFLSGMWWEQSCDSVEENETIDIGGTTVNKLTGYFLFALNTKQRIINVSGITSPIDPAVPDVFWGNAPEMDSMGFSYTNNGYTFVFRSEAGSGYATYYYEIVRFSTVMWRYSEIVNPTSPLPWSAEQYVLTPIEGTGAGGNAIITKMDVSFYARFITDVDEINNVSTFELPLDDMTENRNYHKVAPYNRSGIIHLGDGLSSEPTQWGLYQPGKYYVPPTVYPNPELYPLSRQVWGRMSYWFSFYRFDEADEIAGRKSFVLKNCYTLSSVISVLLNKIAPNITHDATIDYSAFLYGTNPITDINQTLLITPKSNVISVGYDQPAQKAPITLKNVTDMLRDCFRCYWFIDEQNRFRVEHIQYFRNGGSYSGSPVVGIDLTTQKVPRNGKEWAFARDQYKFDKPEMAARYQFGWMDDVTQLFEGFPIDIISKYVNPDNIEQIDISRFTSDIDYILLNPGDVSKDGFVLMAGAPDSYSNTVNSVTNTYYRNIISVNLSAGEKIIVKYLGDGMFSSNNAALYDSNGHLYGAVINGVEKEITLIQDAVNLQLLRASDGVINSGPVTFQFVRSSVFSLPYYNFEIEGNEHILQNAYVAFCLLQRYYAYDMPAPNYEINGVQMYAQGIKKLKNQTIRFPALNDPDLVRLIKTNLGNGVIEKLSVNLSSRSANATLKYDTE